MSLIGDRVFRIESIYMGQDSREVNVEDRSFQSNSLHKTKWGTNHFHWPVR